MTTAQTAYASEPESGPYTDDLMAGKMWADYRGSLRYWHDRYAANCPECPIAKCCPAANSPDSW